MMPTHKKYAVDIEDIQAAAERLKGRAHRTPLISCQAISDAAHRDVLIKAECFQKAGAFKFRGATNAVMQLDEATAQRGVVTHSSGNHAQALALAAKVRGIPAYVVMPENAKEIKKKAVESYGGVITLCEPTLQAREDTAAQVLKETGGTFVHPYNDARVIAGQGTCGLEIIEQSEPKPVDVVVVPVGGGGLLSGIALALAARSPSTKLVAAEPLGADDAARSMQAGALIEQTSPNTIADGLLTSLGSLTWPIIHDHVERVVTVTDDAIIAAMRLVWERAKIIIEPSSAVSIAAILDPVFQAQIEGQRVIAVVTGGNLDLGKLPF
jgi:threonine dehydratase